MLGSMKTSTYFYITLEVEKLAGYFQGTSLTHFMYGVKLIRLLLITHVELL
jgi:hypothetical protein